VNLATGAFTQKERSIVACEEPIMRNEEGTTSDSLQLHMINGLKYGRRANSQNETFSYEKGFRMMQ